MKADLLQILWHDRNAVLSIDFHPTIRNLIVTSSSDSSIRVIIIQCDAFDR
jgi:hypothetical protein